MRYLPFLAVVAFAGLLFGVWGLLGASALILIAKHA